MALEHCLQHSADGRFALRELEEVEVAIVTDRVIEDVHLRFLKTPGATDVITFDYGEIVISAETAVTYARKYQHDVNRELGLYIIHGLLHLNGYDDLTPGDAELMHRTQQDILEACLAHLPNV